MKDVTVVSTLGKIKLIQISGGHIKVAMMSGDMTSSTSGLPNGLFYCSC